MKFSRYIRVTRVSALTILIAVSSSLVNRYLIVSISDVVATKRALLVSVTYTLTLVELRGFEPLTPCLQGRCSPNWATPPFLPLSYWVVITAWVLFNYGLYPVGLSGLEPPTSRLSGVRSNQLSYKPFCFSLLSRQPPTLPHRLQCSTIGRLGLNHRVRDGNGCAP